VKIAIIGSRKFNDFDLMINSLAIYQNQVTQIISGGAKGADQLAEKWSKQFLNKNPIVIRPEWRNINHQNALIKYNKAGEKYDARAGLRRNQDIVNESDMVIAFWDGESKGTKHVISYARQVNKPIKIVLFKENFQMEFPF